MGNLVQFQFSFSILIVILPLRVKGAMPPPGRVPAHAAALPILVEAGYLHVSLSAPNRVVLLQLLQLDSERGSGWVRGGGTGDLLPACIGYNQMVDLKYRLTLLHFLSVKAVKA